jgi:hypothetical protein
VLITLVTPGRALRKNRYLEMSCKDVSNYDMLNQGVSGTGVVLAGVSNPGVSGHNCLTI